MRVLIALAVLLIIAICDSAYGATNLPIGCPTATVGQNSLSCGNTAWQWVAPANGSKVLRLNSTGNQIDYYNATWQLWESVLPTERLWVCQADRTVGTRVTCPGQEGFVLKSSLGPPPPPAYTEPRTLRWDAPTTNADGSPLTDLAGYRLGHGTTSNNYSENVSLGLVTSYTFAALGVGPHFFGVYAGDSNGNESVRSNEHTLTISQGPPPPTCPPPQPADESQTVQCTSPQVGSWTQTRTYSCQGTTWTAGAWTPASAPPGVCVTPPPTQQWRVAPIAAGTRPVYEAVLNTAGATLVRGNQEGSVPVGTPCGNELFRLSNNSYRAIADAQAILNSPTYRGRQHAAICRLQ